jgi:xanthine dehydrogenase molybdopterin-binding subunit B
MTGDVIHDEEIFISSVTPCVGSIIGVVLADNDRAASTAANLVQIEYELLQPTIFTIDDAIKHQSYLGDERCLQQGDVNKGFDEADQILKGSVCMGGQEHFYLETNCCIAVPSNDDQEITLYSSTQNPSKTQELTALALGYDVNRVQCHVKRMGGKESRSYVIELLSTTTMILRIHHVDIIHYSCSMFFLNIELRLASLLLWQL